MEKEKYSSPLKAAICEFKKKAITIKKETTNPFFKSKYADLATILDAIEVEAANCGIVIVSGLVVGDTTVLQTTLSHKDSAETIISTFPVIGTKPQEIGSSISYARRYNIQSLLNLAAEDDDGNAANAAEGAKAKSVFANAALLKKFTQNVIDSFNQIDEHDDNALETLKTLSELNAEKIAELKNSGNEHDGLAVDEIRKQYTLKKNLIDQTRMMNEQMKGTR